MKLRTHKLIESISNSYHDPRGVTSIEDVTRVINNTYKNVLSKRFGSLKNLFNYVGYKVSGKDIKDFESFNKVIPSQVIKLLISKEDDSNQIKQLKFILDFYKKHNLDR